MSYNFADYYREANFSKTLRILRGEVPHVNTLAIITAHNPMGNPMSQRKNEELNRSFKAELRRHNFSPIRVGGGMKGKYGGVALEDSFIVPHISRDAAIRFGEKYGQKAIIFGEKQQDPKIGSYIRFEWHERETDTQPFQMTQTRNVVLSGDYAKNLDDLYSAVKMKSLRKDQAERDADRAAGRPASQLPMGDTPDTKKFVIPFFNDDYAKATYTTDRRGVDQNVPAAPQIQPLPDELRKAEGFYIPFFDDIAAGVIPDCEVDQDVSFLKEELPDTDAVKEAVCKVAVLEADVYPATPKTEKHQWVGRGNLNMVLQQLRDLISK